ncbi:hypothetical protein GCM10025771_05350 [Niveibacterium umoris]|uniref:DUF3293 domain-containing protein n=1 Tax=Niveibacterium umoris TaxID=1193620 RepID=A0A840BU80_9RHOO|nr:DUF3293 domain-containing protein [Niveibacterium umoris]MBB4013917.1 hypothetical protein [Niveibacterium umoris]
MISVADSTLPASLIEAYRSARYRILAPLSLTLQIDQPEPALTKLLNAHGSAAIVTAVNPGSRLLGAEENAQRLAALRRVVAEHGVAAWPARGESPLGEWPDEESLFLPGASHAFARTLAESFGQNAFVAIAHDLTPRLILLR